MVRLVGTSGLLTYAFNAPQLVLFTGTFEYWYLRDKIFPSDCGD